MCKRPQCPTGYIALKRECGHQQAVAIKCKSPLCPTCERERAAKVAKRWRPTLEGLPELKLMTLTLRSGHDLAPHLAELDTGFRALLDFRIGKDNRAMIEGKVSAKVAELQARGSISTEQGNQWKASAAKWLGMIEKRETKHGKSFKLRKLLKGLSSLEITYNESAATWHAHRHIIVSMPYMPQIVLSELWSIATEGRGQIVDVRAIGHDLTGGLKEALKYTAKAWEIPDDKADELLAAVKGKKRVWPIGRIKPADKEPTKCPDCQSEECTCKRVAMVSTSDKLEDGSYDIHDAPTPQRLIIRRDKKRGLVWEVASYDPSLSLYRPKYQEKAADDGTHDPPRGARVFISRDLTITLPQTNYERRKEAAAAEPAQLQLTV